MMTPCEFAPSLPEHMRAMPFIYRAFIPIVMVCFLAITSTLLGHIIEVYRIGVYKRIESKSVRLPPLYANTIMMLSLPVVIVLLKLLQLLFPRQHQVLVFLCAAYEAMTFASFLDLINIYLDGPEEALSALMSKPIRKEHNKRCGFYKRAMLWLCCFKRITASAMLRINVMVYQFVVVYPMIHLMTMMMPQDDARRVVPLRLVSIVVCVHALLFLTWSSEHLLLVLNIHRKFWTMKCILLANAVLLSVLEFIHRRLPNVRWYVGNAQYSEVAPGAWAALLTSLILVPLSFLIRKAFTADEFPVIPMNRCAWTVLEEETTYQLIEVAK